jgi:AraC-like DNA-binding protein
LADNYLKRLNELVADKKPFLNGNLSSKELASDLGISANNLSQIINQIEGKTFYQYINDKRIEEVVLLMTSKDNNHVSNEGLGYQSDINSRSTFLKAFKQKLGMSPSEFRKKIG